MGRGMKMSGQENRRHPETPSYRCFLSDLTGFAGLRRAGPTRTAVRIPEVRGDVNHRLFTNRLYYLNKLRMKGLCGQRSCLHNPAFF